MGSLVRGHARLHFWPEVTDETYGGVKNGSKDRETRGGRKKQSDREKKEKEIQVTERKEEKDEKTVKW